MAAACARTGVGVRTAVPAISPSEAYWRVEHKPETLVIDVREAKSAASAGLVPGSVHIPLEVLSAQAWRETPVGARDPRLPDLSRPIIVTCQFGPDGARGSYAPGIMVSRKSLFNSSRRLLIPILPKMFFRWS